VQTYIQKLALVIFIVWVSAVCAYVKIEIICRCAI